MRLFGPRAVCVMSNKGGTGKTAVSIGVARALARREPVVLLDLDLHGPDVFSRLGLDPNGIDFAARLIEPLPVMPNLWAFSSDCMVDDDSSGYLAKDEDKRSFIKSSFTTLNFHHARYVICDMPAGTDEALYVMLKELDLHRAILVTNPERSCVLDTEKLVNILVHYGLQKKILGVIENMAYVQGPDGLAGKRFNDANVKLELCTRYDIPYLGSIPELVAWNGRPPDPSAIYREGVFETIAGLLA